MKKSLCLVLIICLFLVSCNKQNEPAKETASPQAADSQDKDFEMIFHQNGEIANAIPDTDNFIIYARTQANDEWVSWDYSARTVKNAERGEKYDIYIYEVDRIFSSFDELKSSEELKLGETVGILSYYEGACRGSAVYSLSDIKGTNGVKTKTESVYANIVPFTAGEERIVTVDMFGAYANGEDSDHEAINKALREDCDTVEFESPKYLQKHSINLNHGDIFINGKGATVENLYETITVNCDFAIVGKSLDEPIKNITVKNLNFTCTEESGKGYLYTNGDHIQIKISNAHNVNVNGCTLIVPPEGDEPRQVDSIWANGGISDITIQNCYISNYCDSGLGGGIWLSASSGEYGCKNAVIRNNYVEKNSCDEVFALFFGDFENVIIENNKFITKDHIYPDMYSNNGIGIGVWDIETHCKNIKFIGNEVSLSLGGTAFIFSDSDNVEIAGNKIYVTTTFGDQNVEDTTIIEKAIFRLPEPEKGYKVTNTSIHDNYIEVSCGDYTKNGYNLHTLTESFHDGCEFYNNEIVLNCIIKRWTNNDSSYYHDNKITVNGDILLPDLVPHEDFYEKNEIVVNNSI